MLIFSERLKNLRDEKNVLSKDLAKDLNITESKLSYYMNGKEPNFETLVKIADYFNVSTDYLVGRTHLKNYEDKNLQEIILGDLPFEALTVKQNDEYMKIQTTVQRLLKNIFGTVYIQDNEEKLCIDSELINASINILSDILTDIIDMRTKNIENKQLFVYLRSTCIMPTFIKYALELLVNMSLNFVVNNTSHLSDVEKEFIEFALNSTERDMQKQLLDYGKSGGDIIKKYFQFILDIAEKNKN